MSQWFCLHLFNVLEITFSNRTSTLGNNQLNDNLFPRRKYFVTFFFLGLLTTLDFLCKLCSSYTPSCWSTEKGDPERSLILNHFDIFAHQVLLSDIYALYLNPSYPSKTRPIAISTKPSQPTAMDKQYMPFSINYGLICFILYHFT